MVHIRVDVKFMVWKPTHLQYFKIQVRNILWSRMLWKSFNTLALPFINMKNKY